jgi:hypothetical protein
MRRLSKTLLVLLLAAACLMPAAAAAAPARTRSCSSADLRYPFSPAGPKAFGVFRLRIAGGTCATAHRVAKAWMTRFEAAFRAGRTVLPRSVDGFTFVTVPARLVQAFRERGQMGGTTIWFDYLIPNG